MMPNDPHKRDLRTNRDRAVIVLLSPLLIFMLVWWLVGALFGYSVF
jgi:hypothetical protein